MELLLAATIRVEISQKDFSHLLTLLLEDPRGQVVTGVRKELNLGVTTQLLQSLIQSMGSPLQIERVKLAHHKMNSPRKTILQLIPPLLNQPANVVLLPMGNNFRVNYAGRGIPAAPWTAIVIKRAEDCVE